MKKYIIYIGLILMGLNACEDPIDVELNQVDAQLVVDAWLDNVSENQSIRISVSRPYFENQFTEGITDATVMVNNTTKGESFEFTHTSDGNYAYNFTNGNSIGDIGDEYTLDITVGNNTYQSVSTLNRVPQVDSISQEFRENEAFTDDGIYCEFFARDLQGLGDTYWIKTYKNGQYLNRSTEINLAFDAGFDSGGEVDGLIFIFPIRDLINEVDDDGAQTAYLPGDNIKVEIHSVTNEAWSFLEIMRDQLLNSQNGIFAEPLANTQGNITHTNGDDIVLGVFNVAAISSLEYTVQ